MNLKKARTLALAYAFAFAFAFAFAASLNSTYRVLGHS